MEEPANPPIRFDQTPYTRFYMCRSLTCRNHVLSMKDYLREEASLDAVICQNPVNVRANNVESRFLRYNQFLVDVFCNECNRKLGHKSVGAPNSVVQEGRFILFLKQMLYWNGNRVVYADTEQPVEDN